MKEKTKQLLKKIKQNLKKVAKWIVKNIKWIALVIGGFMVVMCVKNIIAKIGSVKKNNAWSTVPGDKTKVFVYTEDDRRVTVSLPKNPRNNKQITSDDIKAIGISDKSENVEDLYVEILHIPTNRK